MKVDIHPKYYSEAKVRCACGATYVVGSTKESYIVDICGSCHPFYTGKQKLVDTAGRVDKFMARQKAAAQKQAVIEERTKGKVDLKFETAEEKVMRKVRAKEEAKIEAEEPKPVVAHKVVAKKPVAKKVAKPVTALPTGRQAKKPVLKKAASKPVAKKKK